jgi:CheY-like chemotaxis protein
VPIEAEVLFKGFSDEERSEFLAMGGERRFAANEVLLAAGQDESHLGIVQEGEVSVWADRARLTRLGPGGTLGTSSVIEPHVCTVVVRADTDGALLTFPRQRALEFFRGRPERLFYQFCANIFSIWVEILERRNRRIFELQSALIAPAARRRGRPKVLIVDDEHPIRDAFGDLLKDAYLILKAIGGEEAIRLTYAEKPDLLLLDLRMPGIDGYEVIQRLKSDPTTSHIPIVVVTALTETHDKVKGLLYGADDYLIKPVDAEDLTEKVRQILRRFENVLPQEEEASP